LKWFLKGLLVLSVIPLQSIVLEKIQIGGIKPDLALVLVFFQGWFFGVANGLYWGAALGGLLDLFSLGILGVGLVAKGLVGLVAGLLGKSFLHLSIPLHLIIFMAVSVIHDLAGSFFLHGADLSLFQAGLGEVLSRAAYNSLFGLGYIFLVRPSAGNQGELAYGGTIFPSGRSRLRK